MRVCIDPGHGMSNRQTGIFDPGATHVENGFRYQEADIALRYGLSLKDAFRAKSIDVFMTRDDSTDHAPVARRAKMAKDAGCDILISLHLNDFEDDEANGLEVLYGSGRSEDLAQRFQNRLISATNMRDRGIKLRKDLAVLKFDGPAVLIELGFIGNDADRQKVIDPQVRNRIIRVIVDVTQSEALALA